VGLLYKKGLSCVHQFLIGVVGLVIGVRESLMGRLGALHLGLFRVRLKNQKKSSKKIIKKNHQKKS